eukprot:8834637-Alexandrium_andersonii.AAC.1
MPRAPPRVSFGALSDKGPACQNAREPALSLAQCSACSSSAFLAHAERAHTCCSEGLEARRHLRSLRKNTLADKPT